MDPAAKPSGVPFSQAKEDETGMFQKTNCVVGVSQPDHSFGNHPAKILVTMPVIRAAFEADSQNAVALETGNPAPARFTVRPRTMKLYIIAYFQLVASIGAFV